MAKYNFNSGGQVRNAPIVIKKAKAKKKDRKKGTTAGKLALGIVTGVNLALTVAVHVMNRRDIIHAVQDEEAVKLLLTQQAKTEEKQA